MPLLYGEGDNAWVRLQVELMRLSNDETLFAWRLGTYDGRYDAVVAHGPEDFERCNDTAKLLRPFRLPYALTNQGLQRQLTAGDAFYAEVESDAFEVPSRYLAVSLVCCNTKVLTAHDEANLVRQRPMLILTQCTECTKWSRVACVDSSSLHLLRAELPVAHWTLHTAETIYMDVMKNDCRHGRPGRPTSGSLIASLTPPVVTPTLEQLNSMSQQPD